MLAHKLLPDHALGVSITETPEGLSRIALPDCAGIIWNRQPLRSFQTWIDALSPDQLPKARITLRPEAVKQAVTILFESKNVPNCIERSRLIDDIVALADIFSAVVKAPYLRIRLDAVTTNACRKFHTDALTVRLICTYRGTGTQYGVSNIGADPKRVFTVPTGSPIALRGSLWPVQPTSGLLHRSPPIDGTGETRFVLVLDPVFDEVSEH